MSEYLFCDTGSESHPRHLICIGRDADDAAAIAEELGAHHHSDSGDWLCAEYVEAQYAEGMAMAREHEREQRSRRTMERDAEWRESILSRADDTYDAWRDNGQSH